MSAVEKFYKGVSKSVAIHTKYMILIWDVEVLTLTEVQLVYLQNTDNHL